HPRRRADQRRDARGGRCEGGAEDPASAGECRGARAGHRRSGPAAQGRARGRGRGRRNFLPRRPSGTAGEKLMIRTVASIAIVAVVAWLAIKIVFGFAGSLIGLLLSLAFFALKVALVVGLVYWLLTVFSPETARKMRDALRGESL